ncbi:hypothetical protein Ccrd_010429 [Cynara cardunculus var. scolymus]|uniref:Protein kinase domain-containing protein n=1 Tax=Cynara cardunculus var. scolymus TaxID=59895 RepID=A0A118K6T3_CYNCS|nr:hypothetical protein Ccrd_010429 [Cynara cardunculus var. scolymus]
MVGSQEDFIVAYNQTLEVLISPQLLQSPSNFSEGDGKLYIFLKLVMKGLFAKLYERDIRCANILVDVSGSVTLADFGLAKVSKEQGTQPTGIP